MVQRFLSLLLTPPAKKSSAAFRTFDRAKTLSFQNLVTGTSCSAGKLQLIRAQRADCSIIPEDTVQDSRARTLCAACHEPCPSKAEIRNV